MLTTLLAAGLTLGGGPTIVEPKIVSASLFKNGFAVVVREAALDPGGTTLIQSTPSSTLGTLWFTTSPGTKLQEIVSTQVKGSAETVFGSLDEVLQGNVGKKVTLAIVPADPVVGGSRTGKLLSANGSVVVLQGTNTTIAVPKTSVASVVAEGEDLLWKKTTDTTTRALRVRSTGPGGGKVFVVSLERGITWAPAYSVDISDRKTLKLVAKATILNDLGDMDGVETRLVTGFPNVPFAGTPDPFSSGQPMEAFLNALMQMGTPVQYQGTNGMMTQNSMRADSRAVFDDAFTPNPTPGEKIEDLFFYKQPDVKLAKGERAYYVLFSMEAPYEHVYTWEIGGTEVDRFLSGGGGLGSGFGAGPAGAPEDVWHCLRFKNTGTRPFTTGPAVTFKNGELIGQDLLNYVSPGAEAELKVTKALDIRAERTSEQVAREQGAIKRNDGYPIFDLVTVKETLQISNRQAEKAKMSITRDLVGEVVKADGAPKIVKTAKGLKDVNVVESVKWDVDVDAGKTTTLTFTYTVYVPTNR